MSDGEIPEFGGSLTFDSDGNLRAAEVHVEVPGAAGGDPLQYTWQPGSSDEHPAPIDPGWMPNQQPPFDATDILHAPVPDGWHRDQFGIPHPDLPDSFDMDMRPDEPEYGPGDYPQQQGDEYPA